MPMVSESYYTTDGDIAYIRVRSPHGPVRSEEQPWGLRDYDEQTGDLVGLEVCPRRRSCRRHLSPRCRAWKGVARASSASPLDAVSCFSSAAAKPFLRRSERRRPPSAPRSLEALRHEKSAAYDPDRDRLPVCRRTAA